MSGEQFTPGPWTPSGPFRDLVGGNGKRVTVSGTSFSIQGAGHTAESFANGYVMETAAELYEALKAAMDYIDKSPCDPDIYPEQYRAWERLREARPRETLAKARGEQEGT